MIDKLLRDLFYSDMFRDLRMKYYKDAYEQGRFDEDIEKTYSMGKYAHESDSLFKGNCPDCSYPLPNNIGLCHTGECKKLRRCVGGL